MKTSDVVKIVAAAGGLVAISAVASAQTTIQAPKVINITGATLFENFFNAPASTNDFIDADGDGRSRQSMPPVVDQLAPFNNPVSYALDGSGFPAQPWAVTYRAVGSGNGLAELVAQGSSFDLTAFGDGVGIENAENAYYNRTKFIDEDNGLLSLANTANPGATPFRTVVTPRAFGADTLTSLVAAQPGDTSVDGMRIDMALLDVPAAWFSTNVLSNGEPEANPGASGYGNNPRTAVTVTGASLSQGNKLKDLGSLELKQPGVPGTAGVTVYDTAVAYVPVAPITNFGVGLEEVNFSDLQWSIVAGRLRNGENLMVITRDSGSGTRNGFMNSLCIDPSWGVGENVGPKTTVNTRSLPGPDFAPSNKGGSGTMELTVRNNRLAIGHTGAERGIGRWLDSGELDILGVVNDVNGTMMAQAVRPDIFAVTNNSDPDTGWQIGGPETFSTIGDPAAESIADGGLASGEPQMSNSAAAAYLNNIARSIDNFVADAEGDENNFTPAEFLTLNFVLLAGLDAVPDLNDPCSYISNSALVLDVQDEAQQISQLGFPEYSTFGFNGIYGIVPTRSIATAGAFADGAAMNEYAAFDGTGIPYGDPNWGGGFSIAMAVAEANRVAGDFNNDDVRDVNDAARLVEAWDARVNGATWTGNGKLSPEIVGDFNGDGFFDRYDVRYWADGLAIDPATGDLDRVGGFEAVDAAFGGNFFGTTLATGATYADGDSRGDVANGSGAVFPARGFAPVGAEGWNRNNAVAAPFANVIDEHDIEYVQDMIANGSIDWKGSLIDAAAGDLSADINGDFCINVDDVVELVEGVLKTSIQDVDLNGVVDAADEQLVGDTIAGIITPADPANPLFTEGDLNGDDVVDAADLAIAQGGSLVCAGDTNGDGIINADDLLAVLGAFGQTVASACGGGPDLTGDGLVNADDLLEVLGNFGGNCN